MKRYDIIPPEEKNFCVVSCLQAILGLEGIKINQEDISKKLTPAKDGFKVHDKRIKNFLFEFGFDYTFYWKDETPFNEPESVLEDMRKDHGLVGIDNHSYVFYDFKYPELKLIDPNNAQIKTKDYCQMIKEMCNTKGFFSLIKKL